MLGGSQRFGLTAHRHPSVLANHSVPAAQVGDGVPVYHLLVEGFMMMLVLKMFLWPAPRKGQAVEKLTKKV